MNRFLIKYKRYGFWGFMSLVFDKIYTLIYYPHTRLLRRPIYIRGKKSIILGRRFTSGINLRLDAFPKSNKVGVSILIGDNVQVNDFVHIGAIESIIIEENVLIASKVFITDHNHGGYNDSLSSCPNIPPIKRPLVSSPVLIERNVWIGEFVSILPGVTIGQGSVIGSNSVVTKSIPKYCIAVGSPAKVVKRFNFNSSKWENID